MFNFLKDLFNSGENNVVTIAEVDGRFALCDRRGIQIGDATYSRRRDAVRGATRRGLVVA